MGRNIPVGTAVGMWVRLPECYLYTKNAGTAAFYFLGPSLPYNINDCKFRLVLIPFLHMNDAVFLIGELTRPFLLSNAVRVLPKMPGLHLFLD